MSTRTFSLSTLRDLRPWAGRAPAALQRPIRRLQGIIPHNVELSHLGRYMFIAALAGATAGISAWARIDLRETAVSLDTAERSYDAAQAEQARLNLELSSLRDPTRLEQLGGALALDRSVKVVTVPALPKPSPKPAAAEVASR